MLSDQECEYPGEKCVGKGYIICKGPGVEVKTKTGVLKKREKAHVARI